MPRETKEAIEFFTVKFGSLPRHLKRRLCSFDAGGVYARGIFLNLPSPRDADFEILNGGKRLKAFVRRRLTPQDFRFIGVAVERAGVIRIHFIDEQGEVIQG